MMQAPFVYLASQSPRRAQLLAQIGVAFELLSPQGDEERKALEQLEERRGSEKPARYVRRVALLKLEAAARRLMAQGANEGEEEGVKEGFMAGAMAAAILCADTTVDLGGAILGKPEDARHARQMLGSLSGREHRVLTAVAVRSKEGAVQSALSISRVRFAALPPRQLDAYIESGEWQGKAGAYAIQGRAGAFALHMSGSYSAIMGLPLYETTVLLRQAGLEV